MVSPTPAADPGAAPAPAWLSKLLRQLDQARKGILFALTEATPTQLGPVVRALSKAPPWSDDEGVLEVCLRAEELLAVPSGSRVLLRVRVEDLEWLNLNRPIFADRQLRAVLWLDEVALDGLVRNAVDLFDWVSRVVPVPAKALPDFAVDGVREALARGEEFVWTGGRLDEVLAAAGCDRAVEFDGRSLFGEIVASLSEPGIPVASGIRFEQDVWRVRIALAWTGRGASWVARDPELELAGVRRLTTTQEDWDAATEALRRAGSRHPGLLAAWWELDPERIAWLVGHLSLDPNDVELAPTTSGSLGDETPDSQLLTAMRQLGAGTPKPKLVQLADAAGFDDVAASLMLVRWERGAEPWPERLIWWLMNHGHTARAIAVASKRLEQAMAAGDSDALAVAQQQHGTLCYLVADLHRARAHLEASATLFLQSPSDSGSDRVRDLRYATLLCNLGRLDEERGRWNEAHQFFKDALGIALRVAEREPDICDAAGHLARAHNILDGDALTVQELDADIEQVGVTLDSTPHDVLQQQMLARLLRKAGESYLQTDDHRVTARRRFRRSVAMSRALVEHEPERLDFQRELVRGLRTLGWANMAMGLFKAARNVLTESVEIAEALVVRAPDSLLARWDLGFSVRTLDELYAWVGDTDFARGRRRRDAINQTFEPKPPGYLDDLAVAHLELALSELLDQTLRHQH